MNKRWYALWSSFLTYTCMCMQRAVDPDSLWCADHLSAVQIRIDGRRSTRTDPPKTHPHLLHSAQHLGRRQVIGGTSSDCFPRRSVAVLAPATRTMDLDKSLDDILRGRNDGRRGNSTRGVQKSSRGRARDPPSSSSRSAGRAAGNGASSTSKPIVFPGSSGASASASTRETKIIVTNLPRNPHPTTAAALLPALECSASSVAVVG